MGLQDEIGREKVLRAKKPGSASSRERLSKSLPSPPDDPWVWVFVSEIRASSTNSRRKEAPSLPSSHPQGAILQCGIL